MGDALEARVGCSGEVAALAELRGAFAGAAFGVGLLVAAPVVVCSLVAAYQHLFGGDDRTGFLKAN
mgnify:CR=1 FL=1